MLSMIFRYKKIISRLFLILILISISNTRVLAKEVKYISLAPSITEIIYAIHAQDNLIAGVAWDGKLTKNKPSVGNSFFINNEALVKFHPDIIFALDYQKPIIDELKISGIKIYYFSFKSINSILECINITGKLTNHTNDGYLLVNKIQKGIDKSKSKAKKRLLFVVQAEPLISVGKYSFINDIILQSGNINILENLNTDYPRVNLEYIIKQKPDLIIVADKNTKDYLKKFLHCNYVILTPAENDAVNRPGPSVIDSVKFFSKL